MEVLSPASSYLLNSSWLYEGRNSTKWTTAENQLFENALAIFDKDTPDRWHKVADMVPGKTVLDVMRQYKELEDDVSSIEAGLIPIPVYGTTSPFTLEWGNNHGLEGLKQVYVASGKRSSSTRSSEHERKKGVPWTEEEHKLFLMGLKKYGKGDWRNISRNYVITRTPTQVASHAQKYFIRQLSGGKDKRRASIHDITVNLEDNPAELTYSKRNPSSEQSTMLIRQINSAAVDGLRFQWNQPNSAAMTAFNQSCGRMFMSSPYATNRYGLEPEVQNLQRSASYVGPQNLFFQMQTATQHYPHG